MSKPVRVQYISNKERNTATYHFPELTITDSNSYIYVRIVCRQCSVDIVTMCSIVLLLRALVSSLLWLFVDRSDFSWLLAMIGMKIRRAWVRFARPAVRQLSPSIATTLMITRMLMTLTMLVFVMEMLWPLLLIAVAMIPPSSFGRRWL